MGSHPLNLAYRFILELLALTSLGLWGWRLTSTYWRYAFVLLIPLIAAVVWGVFNVPGDPSRSGEAPIIVPGYLRLMLEFAIFLFASIALYHMGYHNQWWIFAGLVILHYLLSVDRITWLLAH